MQLEGMSSLQSAVIILSPFIKLYFDELIGWYFRLAQMSAISSPVFLWPLLIGRALVSKLGIAGLASGFVYIRAAVLCPVCVYRLLISGLRSKRVCG